MSSKPQRLCKSDKYHLFKMHPKNRVPMTKDGRPRPRPDLLRMMSADGFKPTHPIIAVKDGRYFVILDGHNRFVCAQHLGIPFWYVWVTKAEAQSETPAGYNTGIRQWSLKDFLQAFKDEDGLEDYAELSDYVELTGIGVSNAISMFSGETAGSGNQNQVFKRGLWSISDREHPEIVANIVFFVSKIDKTIATNSNFVRALSRALRVPGFEVDHFIKKVAKYPELLTKQKSLDFYIGMIEEIYNRQARGKRLYLQKEIDEAMRARQAVPRVS